jgi:transposase
MNNIILAIDLGKYKSVACVLDESTGEYRFTTFDTSRAEMQKLISKEPSAVVIIEACLLAGWVHDLCGELGVRCLVANTASEAWKFKHLKRKTDKDDALRLVQLYVLNQLPTVTLPTTNVRQWRSLIACRQTWVGRRVAVQNRIRALFVAQGLPAPRGAKAWSTTGLAGIASQAKPLEECEPDELWRGLLELALTEYRQVCELIAQAETRLDALAKQNADVILLQTTPGLGPRTAEVVAAYLNDASRFKTGKQVSAYGGRDGSAWSDHQARPGAVAETVRGVRLVHAALQRLGPRHLFEVDRRRPASQEAGDRGLGTQDPGALLGHVARQESVARSAGGSEKSAAALEATTPGGGATASASKAVRGA